MEGEYHWAARDLEAANSSSARDFEATDSCLL
jgi:hypothetical protein